MEPKQKHHPVADVTGDGSRNDAVKSNIAEEPGMLGPWQDKLEVVKWEMTRVNIEL